MKENRRHPATARRVAGDILIAFFAVFTLWLSAVMLHRIHTVVLADTYRKVFRNELVLCAVLLVFALDLRFGLLTRIRFMPARILGWILRLAAIAGTLAILALAALVIGSGMADAGTEAAQVIVLGMALEDGQPTKDLRLRVETAADYAAGHPEALLVLTGGNPDARGRTEADVMFGLLTERGVPAERMLREDRAADTRENFRNAARLLRPDAPTAVISSDYHMRRAVKTAKAAGFSRVLCLPAPSDPLRYGANVMWEIVMELNSLVRGR